MTRMSQRTPYGEDKQIPALLKKQKTKNKPPSRIPGVRNMSSISTLRCARLIFPDLCRWQNSMQQQQNNLFRLNFKCALKGQAEDRECCMDFTLVNKNRFRPRKHALLWILIKLVLCSNLVTFLWRQQRCDRILLREPITPLDVQPPPFPLCIS